MVRHTLKMRSKILKMRMTILWKQSFSFSSFRRVCKIHENYFACIHFITHFKPVFHLPDCFEYFEVLSYQRNTEIKGAIFLIWIFFFFHVTFTIQEGVYYHFHRLHEHLDISCVITAVSSPPAPGIFCFLSASRYPLSYAPWKGRGQWSQMLQHHQIFIDSVRKRTLFKEIRWSPRQGF